MAEVEKPHSMNDLSHKGTMDFDAEMQSLLADQAVTEEVLRQTQRLLHFQREEAFNEEMALLEAAELKTTHKIERKHRKASEDTAAKSRLSRNLEKQQLRDSTYAMRQANMREETLIKAQSVEERHTRHVDHMRRMFTKKMAMKEKRWRLEEVEMQKSQERVASNLAQLNDVLNQGKAGSQQDAKEKKLRAQHLVEQHTRMRTQQRELETLQTKYLMSGFEFETQCYNDVKEMQKSHMLQQTDLDVKLAMERNTLKAQHIEKLQLLKAPQLIERQKMGAAHLKLEQQAEASALTRTQSLRRAAREAAFFSGMETHFTDFLSNVKSDSTSGGSQSDGKSLEGSQKARSQASGVSHQSAQSAEAESDLNAEMKANDEDKKTALAKAVHMSKTMLAAQREVYDKQREAFSEDISRLDEQHEEKRKELKAAQKRDLARLPVKHAKVAKEMRDREEDELKQRKLGYAKDNMDLRERQQREIELMQQAKDEFLRFVCHELRNPLSGIFGLTSLISEGCEDEDDMITNDELKEHVGDIQRLTMTMKNIVDGVLDLSKAAAGKDQVVAEQFDFKKLINETIRTCKNSDIGLQKKLTWSLDFGENCPAQAIGDHSRIRHILSNLMSNATKFTHTSVKVSVTLLKETVKGHECEILVVDDGDGVTQDQALALFQPFKQLKPSAQSGASEMAGTGLGLSIAKGLATTIGADIGVKRTIGAGATFYLRLMLARLGSSKVSAAANVSDNVSVSSVSSAVAQSTTSKSSEVSAAPTVRKAAAGAGAAVAVPPVKEDAEDSRESKPKSPVAADAKPARESSRKAAEPKEESTAIRFDPQPAVGKLKLPPARVLAVDDDALLRGIMVRRLKKEGLTVDEASDGLMAVEKAQANKYQAILMDIVMPRMCGDEATRKIRETDETTPIIGVTANAHHTDVTAYYDDGMNDVILKPFQFDELKATLYKALTKSAAMVDQDSD